MPKKVSVCPKKMLALPDSRGEVQTMPQVLSLDDNGVIRFMHRITVASLFPLCFQFVRLSGLVWSHFDGTKVRGSRGGRLSGLCLYELKVVKSCLIGVGLLPIHFFTSSVTFAEGFIV